MQGRLGKWAIRMFVLSCITSLTHFRSSKIYATRVFWVAHTVFAATARVNLDCQYVSATIPAVRNESDIFVDYGHIVRILSSKLGEILIASLDRSWIPCSPFEVKIWFRRSLWTFEVKFWLQVTCFKQLIAKSYHITILPFKNEWRLIKCLQL